MAVPGKTGSQYKDSEQVILSDSRDDKYGVLATEMVAENTDGTALVRLKTDADGKLQVAATATVDTTGLATSAAQTDGSQKTQIVDAGGEVATVTGGKLDVNATASLAGDAIPATGATTAVTVQIADGSGNQITSFGGGTQYSDGDANADPTGTVAMGTDGSNVFALHTDTAGDLQVDVLSSALPTGAATAANQQTDALTDAQLRATPVPVSGTVTTSGLTDAELRATPVVVDLGANNDVTVTSGAITETNSAAIKTAVETIDNAISGSEMQVDVVTLPAIDTFDLDLGAGTDTRESRGMLLATFGSSTPAADHTAYGDDMASGIMAVGLRLYDGTDYDRARGTAADGLLVNLGTNNDVSLNAGTNAIGKLAANSGVDIGDVTLNNTLGAGTSDASTLRTTESTGATGTLSNVSASASSVTVLAANTSRREAILYNDSTSDAYLKFGSTASATSFTFKWNSYDTIIVDKYNGILTAIWDSATGTARVTETT